MRKIVVEITGKSGKSFDLTLKDTAWIGIGGDWDCLPGYMPATKGHMDYDSSYEIVYLWNREMSLGERVVWLASDPETPAPAKMNGSLKGFKSSVAVGQTGSGSIFDYGSAAKAILLDVFGSVSSIITWKVKSVG